MPHRRRRGFEHGLELLDAAASPFRQRDGGVIR